MYIKTVCILTTYMCGVASQNPAAVKRPSASPSSMMTPGLRIKWLRRAGWNSRNTERSSEAQRRRSAANPSLPPLHNAPQCRGDVSSSRRGQKAGATGRQRCRNPTAKTAVVQNAKEIIEDITPKISQSGLTRDSTERSECCCLSRMVCMTSTACCLLATLVFVASRR